MAPAELAKIPVVDSVVVPPFTCRAPPSTAARFSDIESLVRFSSGAVQIAGICREQIPQLR